MPTVDDLRTVFAELERAAPSELRDAERVLAEPRRRARRGLAIAAAAVVVIGVGIGVAVTRGGNAPEPRPAHPQPTPTVCPSGQQCPVLDGRGQLVPTYYTLDVAGVADTAVAVRTFAPTAETVLLSTGTKFRGGAVARYADAIAPPLTRTGAADVPGHDAFYVQPSDSLDSIGKISSDLVGSVPRIAWDEDGWTTVVLTGSRASRADALALARAVRTVHQPIALPLRFTALPDGVVPDSVEIDYHVPGMATIAVIGFSYGRPTAGNGTGRSPDAVTVKLASTADRQAQQYLERMEDHELAQRWRGRPVYQGRGEAPMNGGLIVQASGTLAVLVSPNLEGAATTPTRLLDLIAGLDLAPDPPDASTWFTSDLFPRH